MMCKSARNFRAAVAGLARINEEGTDAFVDGSIPLEERGRRWETSTEGGGKLFSLTQNNVKLNQKPNSLLGELTDVGRKVKIRLFIKTH